MKKQWKRIFAAALSGVLGVTGFLCNPAKPVVLADSQPVVTAIPNTDRTQVQKINSSFFSVTGFAKGGVQDRSDIAEGDSRYAVVTNAMEFLQALEGAKFDQIDVIELRDNIYLGWHELSEEAKSWYGGSIIDAYKDSLKESGAPVSNPSMVEAGISQVTLSDTNGLTIFSENGNTIEHAEFKLEDVDDLVIRNINFYNVWDWDDQRTSGYGKMGDMGTTKRTGWSYMKLNHAKNVWFDHCNFGVAYDGCVDIENGSRGISITWCNIGDMDYSKGSMLYKTATLMDYFYEKNKEDSSVGVFKMYQIMRDNKMTNEEIMKYMGHHKKAHLGGGGDSDSWYFDARTEEYLGGTPDKSRDNANEYLRMTFAYNNWYNIGSRVPLIRGGVGHLFNNYMDDTALKDARQLMRSTKQEDGKTISDKVAAIGGSLHFLLRGMNARNGASIAADTNVYYNVDEPVIGSENDTEEYKKAGKEYAEVFGYNHSLIVNSRITNTDGKTYEGSNWDNNGDNLFMKGGYWTDKSTINNWSWGQEGEKLSYSYQTFPLDDVKANLEVYGGAYALDMTAKDWLRIEYGADEEIKAVDKNVEVPITDITLSKTEAALFMEEEFLQLDARVVPDHTTESSNDFTWTSSDPEVAEVLGDCGLVVPKALGKTTITVTTKNGLKASCEVTVQNLPTSVKITDVPDEIYEGDVFTLKADVAPGDLTDETVIWQDAGTKTKVLDENAGTFQALQEGSSAVQATANLVGNRITNSIVKKSNKKTLTIKKSDVLATGVKAAEEITVKPGEKAALGASVVPADTTNKKLTYVVSDSAIATVDQDGNVTGVASGETVVIITSVNGGFTAECTVKVAEDSEQPDPPSPEPPEDVMKGDVDGDKAVKLADAQLALRTALHLNVLDERAKKAADVDESGEVDLKDARQILRVALHLDTFEENVKTASVKAARRK